MNEQESGGVHFHFDMSEDGAEPEEVAQLKPVFVRLMLDQSRQRRAGLIPEAAALSEETDRQLYRAAFLADPSATEADFERLWPRLRDEMLCEAAHVNVRNMMLVLTREARAGVDVVEKYLTHEAPS